MSDDPHSIKPQQVTLAAADTPADTDAAAQSSIVQRPVNQMLFAGGAAVAVLALYVVFFWLPARIEPPQAGSSPAAAAPATQPAAVSGADSDADTNPQAPYQEAVDDQQREFAREILARIVDLQGELESLRVDLWGTDEYAMAQEIAAQGDEAFALGDNETAHDHYRHALAQLQTLRERADQLTDENIAAAEQAIAAGDVAAARTSIELLASMHRGDEQVQHLQHRFEIMPRVLALVDDADLAQRNAELDRALTLFRQARQLDPDRAGIEQRTNEVAESVRQRDFRSNMSRGFTAVTRGRYTEAESAFSAAERLYPDSDELAEGRRQLANARTLARISTHRKQALDHVAAEDWVAAEKSFQAALEIDPTLAFANEGLRSAKRWQQTQAQMERFLGDPGVLSDETKYREAVDVYSAATELDDAGNSMRALIDDLETLLQVAAQPVPVRLRSDNLTEVVVYKVARLGRFTQQQLKLRPGRYTIVGTRDGYRDIRRDILVEPDMPPVDVRCDEPLAAAL